MAGEFQFAMDRPIDGIIEVGLPEHLGTLTASVDENGLLTGTVTRDDGASGSFRAEPGDWTDSISDQINFERPDASISATLLKPNGAGPFPAIMMIHGSGDSDRSVAPYRFWGDYLVQRGFAVLLYDKRGNGESTGDWRTVGFETRADDVRVIADFLAQDPTIKSGNIGLMAVSQGVWVASHAAKENPSVAFVIAISGPAVSPADTDAYAGWVASRRAGLSSEEADERRDLFNLYVDAVRNPDSERLWKVLLDGVETAKQSEWFDIRPFDPGPREDLASGWYPLVMDYNPVPALENTNIPILWLYGQNDSQLNPMESQAILEDLRQSGMDYEIHVFPNAGHGIAVPIDSNWRAGEIMTAAPGFFATIDRFLANKRY